MKGLTTKQQAALQAIYDPGRELGHPPTRRELGDGLGLSSKCTVQRHIEALERKGYVRRFQRYTYRGLELTEAGLAVVGAGACPLCAEPASAPLLRDAAGQVWHRGCAAAALAGIEQQAAA